MQWSRIGRKILLFWCRERRHLVFVSRSFTEKYSGDTGLQDFAEYFFKEQVVGYRTITIPVKTAYTIAVDTDRRNFVIAGNPVTLWSGSEVVHVQSGEYWFCAKKYKVINHNTHPVQLHVFAISNTHHKDYATDNLVYEARVTPDRAWPPYPGACETGIDLLRQCIDTKQTAQLVNLSDILHRGYGRVLGEVSGTKTWIRRYNACDVYYPGVVVEVDGGVDGYRYVCRDGNRRTIKMKRLGCTEALYFVHRVVDVNHSC